MRYSILSIFLIFALCAQATAQTPPSPTAKDICAKVTGTEQAECDKALTEMQANFPPDLWAQFSACAITKDLNKDKGKELMACFDSNMLMRLMEIEQAKTTGKPIPPLPDGHSAHDGHNHGSPVIPPANPLPPPGPPANGSFYTPEELCMREPEQKRAECTTSLKEIQALFGPQLWTDFSGCVITKDLQKDNGAEAMACFTPDMMKLIEDMLQKEMEKNQQTAPTTP